MRFPCKFNFRKLFTSFRSDERGVILPLFGIFAVILVVIGGAAIDFSRAVNQREKLSYALDAAALSVAADLSVTVMTNSEIKTALENSLKANLDGESYLEEALTNLTYTVDSNNGTIDVDTNVVVDTFFIDMRGYGHDNIGPKTITVGTASTVAYSQFDVELALVVDVTGSMSGDMVTLRKAATDLVNILIPDGTEESDSKVKISLIPYSQGVNLDDFAEKVKGGEHDYDDDDECVTERLNYDDGTNLYEVQYTDQPYNYYTATSPAPAETFYGGGSSSCPDDGEMVPLTADREELIDAIEDWEASGGTAGQTGIVWGWNSLSPNYSNVWPSESAPAAYDDDDTLKFAIIMTDGDNNRYYQYTSGSSSSHWICDYIDEDHFLWDTYCASSGVSWQEVGESESYSNISSARSRALCDAMETAGIQMFGVYFGSNNNSAGAKNMQSCAGTGNYYQATSSADLINAFANIAKKIQSIYVSS